MRSTDLQAQVNHLIKITGARNIKLIFAPNPVTPSVWMWRTNIQTFSGHSRMIMGSAASDPVTSVKQAIATITTDREERKNGNDISEERDI